MHFNHITSILTTKLTNKQSTNKKSQQQWNETTNTHHTIKITETNNNINTFIEIVNLEKIPTKEQKTNFYSKLVEQLNKNLNLREEDIMISLVENSDEDWSFFKGEAQFLNGAL